jgi:hypothetical protein
MSDTRLAETVAPVQASRMESKRPVVDLSARCACGRVEVTLKGRVLSMFLCSCEDCQKASGTGHAAVILARPPNVTIWGETRSFERPADSGAIMARSFCPQCGTPIVAHSSRAPDVLMLPVGLFGAAAADWFRPNQMIFARSHRDWDDVAAELPRYATYWDKEAMM